MASAVTRVEGAGGGSAPPPRTARRPVTTASTSVWVTSLSESGNLSSINAGTLRHRQYCISQGYPCW